MGDSAEAFHEFRRGDATVAVPSTSREPFSQVDEVFLDAASLVVQVSCDQKIVGPFFLPCAHRHLCGRCGSAGAFYHNSPARPRDSNLNTRSRLITPTNLRGRSRLPYLACV